jgi:Helix-turn-helix domain
MIPGAPEPRQSIRAWLNHSGGLADGGLADGGLADGGLADESYDRRGQAPAEDHRTQARREDLVIRIRFDAEDLTRIRVATLGPFGETMAAAELMRRQPPSPYFGPWRQSLRGRLGPRLRPLAAIHPIDRPGLDLSTLVGRVDTIGEGVDALLSAPRKPFRVEIDWLSGHHSPDLWPWHELDSDLRLRLELGEAITSFHAEAVGPHWTRVRSFMQAERACQVQCLATAGIDEFLTRLCPPLIRWHPPVLTVRNAGRAVREINLCGSGLTIIPSAFISPYPVLATDLAGPWRPPRLIYPAVRDLGTACRLWKEPANGHALAALLGPTRSAALEAIAQECGTAELAQRVGISPAAASQHATVLRAAGLITTARSGRTVTHALTSLGSTLLNGER